MVVLTLRKIDKQVTIDDIYDVLTSISEGPPSDWQKGMDTSVKFGSYIKSVLECVRNERKRISTITGDLQCDRALEKESTDGGSDMDAQSNTHIHSVANKE